MEASEFDRPEADTPELSPNGDLPVSDGVFVYAKPGQGGMQVGFELVGNFDPLAVPTILEIAQRVARGLVGLS